MALWLALSTPRINTETPSDEHVTLCREIFRLHPDLEIEPLGYRRLDSLDISHGFKFIAKTEDPSELLDERLSAMVKFREDFDSSFLDRVVRSCWWKRAQEGGLGTGFESSLNGFFWHTGIYCHRNGDGTLTVWAYAESGANYNEQELKEVGPQEFRGHYYQLFVEKDWLSWDEASARCEARGGYLVVVNEQEENGFLAGLVAGKAPYFLGARSAEGTGAWKWIDGSPMSYQNWLEGQPIANRKAGSHLRAQPFVWPAWCESPGPAMGCICEWDSEPGH